MQSDSDYNADDIKKRYLTDGTTLGDDNASETWATINYPAIDYHSDFDSDYDSDYHSDFDSDFDTEKELPTFQKVSSSYFHIELRLENGWFFTTKTRLYYGVLPGALLVHWNTLLKYALFCVYLPL